MLARGAKRMLRLLLLLRLLLAERRTTAHTTTRHHHTLPERVRARCLRLEQTRRLRLHLRLRLHERRVEARPLRLHERHPSDSTAKCHLARHLRLQESGLLRHHHALAERVDLSLGRLHLSGVAPWRLHHRHAGKHGHHLLLLESVSTDVSCMP
jgi:hypothetical protein